MLTGAMTTVAATTRGSPYELSRTQLRRAQRKHTLSCLRQVVRQATLTASETQVVQSVRLHKADCKVLQLPVRNPSEANNIAMLRGFKSSSQYNADRRLHRAAGKYKHTHFPDGDDKPPPPLPPPPLPLLSILSGLPGAVHNLDLEDFRATLYGDRHGSLNVCGKMCNWCGLWEPIFESNHKGLHKVEAAIGDAGNEGVVPPTTPSISV